MATCPQCGKHGYPGDESGFTLEEVWIPVEGLVSGSTPKIPARVGLRLKHDCGWSVEGFAEGRHLVVPQKPSGT
jgi:hypothetical protein